MSAPPSSGARGYGAVLRTPGALAFSVAALVGRLPIAMLGIGTVLLVEDRRSSYALAGLVSAAYAAGTAVGGDGFLAAFAAGIAVVLLNNALCDCFLEYGETTAEMAMLLAFILFGAVLSTLVGTVPLAATLALAAIVIFVARPLAISLVLAPATISRRARAFIGWFGPRGLSSLLFALLLVHDGVADAERLLAITGLVVFVSVVLHGASATPLAAWYGRTARREDLPEETLADAAHLLHIGPDGSSSVPRMLPAELKRRLESGPPITILDVRRSAAFGSSGRRIPGAIRMPVDTILSRLREIPPGVPVVLYCA